MQAVGKVARFQATPKETHVLAVKRIFKYLKGTTDFGLWYPKGFKMTMVVYINVDWVGRIDDKRITIGANFYLGFFLVV